MIAKENFLIPINITPTNNNYIYEYAKDNLYIIIIPEKDITKDICFIRIKYTDNKKDCKDYIEVALQIDDLTRQIVNHYITAGIIAKNIFDSREHIKNAPSKEILLKDIIIESLSLSQSELKELQKMLDIHQNQITVKVGNKRICLPSTEDIISVIVSNNLWSDNVLDYEEKITEHLAHTIDPTGKTKGMITSENLAQEIEYER